MLILNIFVIRLEFLCHCPTKLTNSTHQIQVACLLEDYQTQSTFSFFFYFNLIKLYFAWHAN